MRESAIETWAVQRARTHDWYVRKYQTQHRRSAPDDIFAKKGRIFFIEFKATGEKPTPMQEHEHKLMRAAGITVHVCDSRESFDEIMRAESMVLGEFWPVC